MPKTKITQNINKDAGLMDVPKVVVPTSRWESRHSNYLSCNTGEIYPIYVAEVMPKEGKKITAGMISHMTTPQAPLFNAMYTELRVFFVPHRLSADLLSGYQDRKSPWVKVFGEDNSKSNAQVIVPFVNQTLPTISSSVATQYGSFTGFNPFGGLYDALDLEPVSTMSTNDKVAWFKSCNHLNLAAYELIYQHCYRNENRESPTSSSLYRFLMNIYNRNVVSGSPTPVDSFHIANREKDYFTGSQPFTQKGNPVTAPLVGDAPLKVLDTPYNIGGTTSTPDVGLNNVTINGQGSSGILVNNASTTQLVADLTGASGISIEQLRVMLKLQESLEKDMMYGTAYANYLNSRFGQRVVATLLDEPLELNKLTITSQMQAIFQTSSTSGEASILGTIGANATTTASDLEILPFTKFNDWGYLIVCAVHKTQNVYDSLYFKPKHLFKFARFDFFAKEIEDLGYQPVSGLEMNYGHNHNNAVSFNEAFAEYRYVFNKCHGMLQPARSNAYDFWTTAVSNYNDIQSLYKQGKSEVDRALSITSQTAPQFYDAYGFIELCEKPMKLHSIPGFDGVI